MGSGVGRTTVLCLPLIAAALVGGWFVVRGRVNVLAREREDA
ncbi:hypothetical protein ACWEQP_32215 [Streptomyces sp. NPDC004044]